MWFSKLFLLEVTGDFSFFFLLVVKTLSQHSHDKKNEVFIQQNNGSFDEHQMLKRKYEEGTKLESVTAHRSRKPVRTSMYNCRYYFKVETKSSTYYSPIGTYVC